MSDETPIVELLCDDAAGYALRILRAPDHDFHLSIVPAQMPDESDEEFRYRRTSDLALYGPSVRIRSGMIGGGRYGDLYLALGKLWPSLLKNFPSPRATTEKET